VHALEPLRGRARAAEHALEEAARIDLHRQRFGLRLPRQRISCTRTRTRDRTADVAGKIFGRRFERFEHGVATDLVRNDLIDRVPARTSSATVRLGMEPDSHEATLTP